MENYLQGWRKYADFSGRASRSEFWAFILGNNFVLLLILASLPFSRAAVALIFTLIWLAALLPSLAVTVRRLQDTGNSGWTLAKPYYSLYLLFKEGDSGPNEYGPDPHDDPEGPNIEDHFIA